MCQWKKTILSLLSLQLIRIFTFLKIKSNLNLGYFNWKLEFVFQFQQPKKVNFQTSKMKDQKKIFQYLETEIETETWSSLTPCKSNEKKSYLGMNQVFFFFSDFIFVKKPNFQIFKFSIFLQFRLSKNSRNWR